MSLFSTCIITASDEHQASVFSGLLNERIAKGLYPREIDFRVYADPPGGRVGSGGGTIWALDRYMEDLGLASIEARMEFLAEHSVLMIHAGGQSRRLPAYVPEGKLFAPVPAASSSVLSPVILDFELALFLKYPWREGELLVASGDVIVDFSTELLDLPEGELCGFAAPETLEKGSRHGVFAFDPLSGRVMEFYQKAGVDFLAAKARIDGTESCAVDLGLISFRRGALAGLFGLLEADFAGQPLRESLREGRVSFDLYVELLSAALGNLDPEAYLERIAPRSSLPREAALALYGFFHPSALAGVLVKNSAFIHFGSLAEFPASCRELHERGLRPFYALHHEELQPEISEGLILNNAGRVKILGKAGAVYVENCADLELPCAGDNFLVGLRGLEFRAELPKGFCIDERRLEPDIKDEKGALSPPLVLRLVYHRLDSFKPEADRSKLLFCGEPLEAWLAARNLVIADIFTATSIFASAPLDLYEAALFIADADADFLSGYWRPPADPRAWTLRFRSVRRFSIAEANARSSAASRDGERKQLRVTALKEAILRSGLSSIAVDDFLEVLGGDPLPSSFEEAYKTTTDPLLREYRGSLLAAAGSRLPDSGSGLIGLNFAPSRPDRTLRCSVKADQIVWARSPLRLDLAGGWTDTPPYTNRSGGAVVNVAVDLNGQPPVQVFLRRAAEPILRFHSIDLGITETIMTIGELRDYRDPSGAFSLPRSALCLLGLGAGEADSSPLEPVMLKAGGGLEISLLCAVPKGSGLGTSSILAGAILAALARFFGLTVASDDLFLEVLELEQMLTTGGGWQDQIGGLIGGVKYLESRPGLLPRPLVHQLDSWLFEERESAECMTLFYTGVTRLAKNILKDVVSRVNGMNRAFLFTHDRLRQLAHEARDAISLRDRPRLGTLIGESFRENMLIHPSTTNEEIDLLVRAASPYISGMKLLGAGGGGFALFMSPDRQAADALRGLIAARFENERARLVDFSLNRRGLEVTVS